MKCPVRALARRVLHLTGQNKASGKTFLCKVYGDERVRYVCAGDVSRSLKVVAGLLQYPLTRGIPINSVDTHSLRSGGANALTRRFRRWEDGGVRRLRSTYEKIWHAIQQE
jgi:hypothetical protein